VNSVSDLFHQSVPFDYVHRIFKARLIHHLAQHREKAIVTKFGAPHG
jgi:protein gp37